MTNIYKIIVILFSLSSYYTQSLKGQIITINGKIHDKNSPIPNATIVFNDSISLLSDIYGNFKIETQNIKFFSLSIYAVGYNNSHIQFSLKNPVDTNIYINLLPIFNTLKTVTISEQNSNFIIPNKTILTEVYPILFFNSNPSPSLFDNLQQINGIRPQINCNICNTGDIHINGLEGPYSLILIDGMPIIGGLSTVYGFHGIPKSIIQSIEVVKGPSSTLYGSEAVGGVINIVTLNPLYLPKLSIDASLNSWTEFNFDISSSFKVSKKWNSLISANYFNYSLPIDHNKDGFTDLTLQNRGSLFNKWNMKRKNNRLFQIALRYIYEDRWGGEMNWNRNFRGGDSIYGESIFTHRWEILSQYDLPTKENLSIQLSYNGHFQNSAYGTQLFIANQQSNFIQFSWNKKIKKWSLNAGATLRTSYYDDNTAITIHSDSTNAPHFTFLPGIYTQNEVVIKKQHSILAGIRFDWNNTHGPIFSPRLNYKWQSKNENSILRIGIGNGFRVTQVFTEDHMALTGSRKVVFEEKLKPEKSWNVLGNYLQKFYSDKGWRIQFDISLFYTYFSNKIIANYDIDPQLVVYKNLDGYAISRGAQSNIDFKHQSGLSFLIGATYMDVWSYEDNSKTRPLFTENFSGTWSIKYLIPKINIEIDYTGNVYSPMRLPIQHEDDPRKPFSPWFSIQNIQIRKSFKGNIELFGGVKNLLNFTPNKGNPFLIARNKDPFDKDLTYTPNGDIMKTPDNPYGLSFDPTYSYAPNQGIRGYIGIRFKLN